MTVWWPALILTPQLMPGSPLFLLHLMMEIVSLCLFFAFTRLLLLELSLLSPMCRFCHMSLCKLVLIKARKLSIVSETYSGRVILSNLGLSGAVILLPKIFLLNPLGYLIHRSEYPFLSFFLGFSRLFSQASPTLFFHSHFILHGNFLNCKFCHIIFFFKFFFHIGYYRILSVVPRAIQEVISGYLF